jgi:hypothetical protein
VREDPEVRSAREVRPARDERDERGVHRGRV